MNSNGLGRHKSLTHIEHHAGAVGREGLVHEIPVLTPEYLLPSQWVPLLAPTYLLKYAKTATILNYFECYFIYAKVCKVYYICLFWLRDFENARAGRKVTLIVRFIFC